MFLRQGLAITAIGIVAGTIERLRSHAGCLRYCSE
jgi:hypothetical protein